MLLQTMTLLLLLARLGLPVDCARLEDSFLAFVVLAVFAYPIQQAMAGTPFPLSALPLLAIHLP